MAAAGHAAEWRVSRVDTPARVTAIETVDGQAQVNAGGLWYRIVLAGDKHLRSPSSTRRPSRNLRTARCPTATSPPAARDIARAWLAEPTTRYDHGILGDKIEAGALVIESRDGKRQTVRLKDDAVFEDLEPRLADLDGDGHDEIVVVKSYLKRGSSLAVIGRAQRQIRDRRRDAAARRRRIAGSIPPASPTSTATAKPINRAGAPAACDRRARIVELARRRLAQNRRAARRRQSHRRHARDRHERPPPISTATASPISPCPRSTAAACASSALRRSRARSPACRCRPRPSPISVWSRTASGPPAIAVGLADGSLVVIRTRSPKGGSSVSTRARSPDISAATTRR